MNRSIKNTYKTIIKILFPLIIGFSTLLIFYKISKLRIIFIDSTIGKYLNEYLGDYGFVWLIVIGINVLLIIDVILSNIKAEKKWNQALSIITIPFYNIIYIWKRNELRNSIQSK